MKTLTVLLVGFFIGWALGILALHWGLSGNILPVSHEVIHYERPI